MRRAARDVLTTICASALLACGGGSPQSPVPGREGSDCYPNGTCDRGLSCLSNLCVRVTFDAASDAGAVGDETRGDAASGAPDAVSIEGGPIDAMTSDTGTTDAGPPFIPAPHPALPQVGTLGGPVLDHPKVQPILYAGETASSDIEAFLKELSASSYWTESTSEYGVGKLTVLPTIALPTGAPAVTYDSSLQSDLVNNTSGANPLWGAADPSTIYLFLFPDGKNVNDQNYMCCSDFGGYHSEVKVGSVTVPYAVGCSCSGFMGFTFSRLQMRTSTISHELVEAATDPFPNSNPAYQLVDRADVVWSVVTGGELADMCTFNDDSYYVPSGGNYMVQRSWSNAAAKLMQNPCVPHVTTAPYFNSFPSLDTITVGDPSFLTQGVNIPIGQTKTIDIMLYSGAPTKNTWAVNVVDYDYYVRGAPPGLGLSLDKNEGRNGDVLHLTITALRGSPNLGAEAFVIISHYGGVRDPDYQTNMTMGLVSN